MILGSSKGYYWICNIKYLYPSFTVQKNPRQETFYSPPLVVITLLLAAVIRQSPKGTVDALSICWKTDGAESRRILYGPLFASSPPESRQTVWNVVWQGKAGLPTASFSSRITGKYCCRRPVNFRSVRTVSGDSSIQCRLCFDPVLMVRSKSFSSDKIRNNFRIFQAEVNLGSFELQRTQMNLS